MDLLVGRNLRRARRATGLSQERLASQLGPKVRREDISRWEHGRHRPTDQNLALLAQILFAGHPGRDLTWFYQDHDDEVDDIEDAA